MVAARLIVRSNRWSGSREVTTMGTGSGMVAPGMAVSRNLGNILGWHIVVARTGDVMGWWGNDDGNYIGWWYRQAARTKVVLSAREVVARVVVRKCTSMVLTVMGRWVMTGDGSDGCWRRHGGFEHLEMRWRWWIGMRGSSRVDDNDDGVWERQSVHENRL